MTISKLAGTAPAGGHRATINGIAVFEYSAEGTAPATIDVPSLHTKLTASSAAEGIVATLQPSATYDLLAAPALQGPQPDWQQVVYAGIQLDVPTSWQLERVGYSPCNSLGSGQPDVVFGPLHSASGCAGEAFPAVPTTDGGVAIDAGGGAPTVGKALVEHHGPLTLTLAAIADTPAGIDVRVTGGAHPVDVEIAIGASANVTAEIIGSIAVASAATSGPTTTTTNAGFAVCATSQLDVALDRRTGASGTALYVFTAKDTGPPCALSGYFRISVYDRSGTLLSATDQLETTNPVGQPASARFLNLATGDEVTIAVAVDENPAGGATTCPIIGSFRLTPPNGIAYRQVAVGSSPYFCGGPGSAIDVYPPTPGAPPEDY